MRLLSIISLVFFTYAIAPAQELISPYGGESTNKDFLSIQYSLGELVIETKPIGLVNFTQGFHQPFLKINGASDPGINNIDDLQIMIYPNPGHNYINIEITNNLYIFNYEIHNLMGQKISEGIISSEITNIDISNLTTANYLLKVYHKEKSISKVFKIIKN